MPPVLVRLQPPALTFQQTASPVSDLRSFGLREEAALHRVSKSVRPSAGVTLLPDSAPGIPSPERPAGVGPDAWPGLVSDEVGSGKTIEAGLVLQRAADSQHDRRYLVLTGPSLVDQWVEELNDKFNLSPVTTTQPLARADPARFWRESVGLGASLHMLKHPALLELTLRVQ